MLSTQAPATLVLTVSGETGCSGLAVDTSYFYTACSGGERVIRIARTTGTVTTILDAGFDASGQSNSLQGRDNDADGVFDYLYVQSFFEEAYFVCDPGTNAPFTGDLFNFGTGAGNYGLGYDFGSNTLWMLDDDNRDIIRVQ